MNLREIEIDGRQKKETKQMTHYSKEEARRLLCRYHNLDGAEALSGKAGAAAIMRRLHSVQYDPLNVVGRNADLVLNARVHDYTEEDLHRLLYEDRTLVDGYDKEMCIYESTDFRHFSRVRSEHLKQVVLTLQYRGQTGALDILDDMRAFVAAHGRTSTKDISIGEVRESRWGPKKLSSAALDYLFNSGELCVAEKRGTQKRFDLAERVLGDAARHDEQNACELTKELTEQEFLEWYTERRVQSVGLAWNKPGGVWQGHFVSDNETRTTTLQSLVEQNRIEEIRVDGIDEPLYAPKDFSSYSSYLEQTPPLPYVRFIAPLDNMLWDRQFAEALFGFAYRWEVYTPAAKRKFGYYVLPVLYNGRFVARFEPEPVRTAKTLAVKNWWWEQNITPNDDMREAIRTEFVRFAQFLGIKPAADIMQKVQETQ